MTPLFSNLYTRLKSGITSISKAFQYGLPYVRPPYYGRLPIIHLDRERELVYEEMRVYTGISTLRHSPYHDNFTQETADMRLTYRRWAAEPSVKASLAGKVYSVASLGLQVKPGTENDPRSQEKAECVRHCFTRPDGGFPGMVYETLIHALMDGWSICEPVWTMEERGPFRGKRVLADYKAKDTRYIIPRVDQFRNVIGLYNPRGNYNHLFDPAHFVLFSHLPLFRNPSGISDLRAVYRAMQMLPAVWKLRGIFLEKYTGPFLKSKVRDRGIKQAMANELAQARAQGYIVLDPDSDVEVLDLVTRGTADFQAAMDDLRKEVATALEGAFLHRTTASDPNSRGDAQVQEGTKDLVVWWLAEQLAATWQRQLVPAIIDYNYGSLEDLPVISLEAVNPQDIVHELAIDESLDRMNVATSLEELRERARRSPPKSPQDSTQAAKQQAQQQGINTQLPGNPFLSQRQASGDGMPAMTFAEWATLYSLSRESGTDFDDWEVGLFDSFAEGTGFTGQKKDRRGRTLCYQSGVRVPCQQGSPPNLDHVTDANGLLSVPNLSSSLSGLNPDALKRLRERVAAVRPGPAPTPDPTPLAPVGPRGGGGPAIDYQSPDPENPVARAIAADVAGRQFLSDFLARFPEGEGAAKDWLQLEQAAQLAEKEALDAKTEYLTSLKALIEARKPIPGESQKAAAKREKEATQARKAAQEKSDQLKQVSAEVLKRSTEAKKAAQIVGEEARKWLMENVKPANPSTIKHTITLDTGRNPLQPKVIDYVPLPTSPEARKAIDDGVAFINAVSGGVDIPVTVGGGQYDRAFYNKQKGPDRSPLVALDPFTTQSDKPFANMHVAETTAHEFGHHLENHIPGLMAAATAFRDYRCGKEAPVKLNSLPGGEDYRDHELGRKDSFDRVFPGTEAYYAGKSYGPPPDSATEIVSMGIEQLYRNPVEFARKDPEYFQWLITALRGKAV